ncbi:MAG: TonB family protein [Vicinamibacteria bacterium]|nr:TonB family protein [Vicinamibacteria bacterium]
MNDPVLRVLVARQALVDEGYSRSLLLSGAAHATTFFAILILALLTPKRPLINVVEGFAVPLPKGGGLPRAAGPAPSTETEAPAPVEPVKPEPRPAAPERLIKPEKVIPKKGVAPVDLKRSVKDSKKIESREIATEKIPKNQPAASAAAPTPGAASAATGLDFAAQTPGVLNGDTGAAGPLGFYLAAAQNRIWATWARQIRPDLAGSVKVAFTIHRDGSIDQVEVIESSGSATIDRLAERAVVSTQLGPIPNSYDKETILIHATFKPLS